MIDHYYLAIVEARLQLSHSGATLKQYFPVNNPRINRKQGLDFALLFNKLAWVARSVVSANQR